MADSTYRYRALEPISVGSVRAYNIGDWVPEENVELHGYEVGVLVERVEIPAVENEDEENEVGPGAPAQPIVPETPPAPEPEAEPEPVKKPRPNPSS